MSVLARLLTRIGDDDPVTLVPMQRRHLRAIMPIEQAAYPTAWTRAVFESELDQVRSGSRLYLVARRGADIVGYAGLWFVPDPDGDQAHVTNIVVAPSARRGGVGTRLMIALAEAAIGRGCASWTLEVRASNKAAQALYRAFGFAPAGVRQRYYDNTEDAIVMWCHGLQSDEYAARLQTLGGAP